MRELLIASLVIISCSTAFGESCKPVDPNTGDDCVGEPNVKQESSGRYTLRWSNKCSYPVHINWKSNKCAGYVKATRKEPGRDQCSSLAGFTWAAECSSETPASGRRSGGASPERSDDASSSPQRGTPSPTKQSSKTGDNFKQEKKYDGNVKQDRLRAEYQACLDKRYTKAQCQRDYKRQGGREAPNGGGSPQRKQGEKPGDSQQPSRQKRVYSEAELQAIRVCNQHQKNCTNTCPKGNNASPQTWITVWGRCVENCMRDVWNAECGHINPFGVERSN